MVVDNSSSTTQNGTEWARPSWFTVHALTEFVFCQRAGVLATEMQSDYENRDQPNALRFSMPYSHQELERSVGRNLNLLWLVLAADIGAFATAIFGVVTNNLVAALVAAVILVILATPTRRRLAAAQRLLRLRAAVSAQTGNTPDLNATDAQPIDWWRLLADDWMSVRNHEVYRDEELCLSGAPWRVLRKGSISIPIFKYSHADLENPQVFPQHEIRLAGYCHLIETCEARDCPCGVLLFGDSYRGVTVPFNDDAREGLQKALLVAREVLHLAAQHQEEPSPAESALCRGCPCGKPRIFRQDVTEISREGEFVPVFGSVATNGKLYHSACGDRFAWVPPHEDSISLGID